ncbi:MAG: aldehyde dehydrogenase family protein [Leptospiraceae bacterium]|nr:aldehyde dehydrogenase family protein [Leptospiraceae bacterium]
MAKTRTRAKPRSQNRSRASSNGSRKKASIKKVRRSSARVPVVRNTPAAEIRRIFELQKNATRRMRLTTAADRIRRLRALRDAIEARTPELYEAMQADFRKSAREVDLTEILPAISEINDAIKHLKRWMAPRKVGTPLPLFGASSEVVYEPRGVVLIISPWNYPFHLAAVPLVAALAAGNTVIMKPSEFTPRTSGFIRQIVADVFPEDEAAVVEGDHTVSQELTALPFDHIFFTGSTAVGKIIMAAASKHLSTVTLELGGKSPAVVREDADMDLTATRILWGKGVNAGQTCVAPDYLLVPADRRQEFIDHFSKKLSDFYGPTPEARRQSPDLCRIVNARHFQRLQDLLNDALKRGARVAAGGNTDASENYIEPTLLVDVPLDAKIMQEEIFGPVLPVLSYGNINEALDLINSRDKPLALYVFSTNRDEADYVIQHTSAGGTVINDVMVHLANPSLPFGGVNHSGHGNYHGEFGFRALSHERAVLRQPKRSAISLMYPPYTNFVRTMARLTKRFLV